MLNPQVGELKGLSTCCQEKNPEISPSMDNNVEEQERHSYHQMTAQLTGLCILHCSNEIPLCVVRNEDRPSVLKLLRQPYLEILRLTTWMGRFQS
jgi:hypothetical protein